MKFYTHTSKTLIATGYTGHISEDTRYGIEYYEFDESHLVKENIRLKYGKPPEKSVYYIWWVSNDKDQIKIHQQLKTVNYADYQIGKWYISCGDLIQEG